MDKLKAGMYVFLFVVLYRIYEVNSSKCMITFDLSVCYSTDQQSTDKVECFHTDVCEKMFNITYVKLEPYNTDILKDLLRTCCGSCINVTEVAKLSKPSEIPPPTKSTSHFVFPVLGRSHALKLYDYYFVPLIKTPSVYYITYKDENQMHQLLMSCINMWPLVLICLLLVFISGFIGWLMETTDNKDQFPRSFLAGWFEGFWWSFISMTTVGYGDKVPKTIAARMFTIVWIFIGITTFSIVTATLSSEITEANTPPSPSMTASKVGAVRHRLYDAIIIEKHGGILVDIDKNVTEGIHDMIHKLIDGEIDGFVLDRYTMLLFKRWFEKDVKHGTDVEFLNKRTIHTEVSSTADEYSYGVLVKYKADYDFIVDFVLDNRDVINTCNGLLINSLSSEMKGMTIKHPLFSTSGEMFWATFISLATIIGCICLFGMLYEIRRRSLHWGMLSLRRGGCSVITVQQTLQNANRRQSDVTEQSLV